MGSPAMIVNCDDEFDRLCSLVLASADVFQIVALHPWLPAELRSEFEAVIFSHRRHGLRFARESFTPISFIERLAREDNELILDKLTKNPSTPGNVLQKIAATSQNPSRLLSIAGHGNASAALLELLDTGNSTAIRRAICHNPNTGLAQLKCLSGSATLDDRKAMARNPQADANLLNTLWQSSDDSYLHAEIAAHDACPPELLALAVGSDLVLLRRKAASNSNLSGTQVMQLMGDSEAQVRVAVLRRIGAKKIRLANEPARRVRRELARQSGLDAGLIKQLSADEDSWVRRWVARNPMTPEALLRVLAQDRQTEVRRGVARNPLLPDDMCKTLAIDPEAWVRAGVAIRPDLPVGLIEQLSSDDSIDVLSGLGRNPQTPGKRLLQIAGHADRDVRRSVILNPQATLAVLQTLLEDPYPMNRAQLSRHGAMGNSQLLNLLDDPEPQVRFSAVQALAARYTDCGRLVH